MKECLFNEVIAEKHLDQVNESALMIQENQRVSNKIIWDEDRK